MIVRTMAGRGELGSYWNGIRYHVAQGIRSIGGIMNERLDLFITYVK
jgi:hypothetical protein